MNTTEDIVATLQQLGTAERAAKALSNFPTSMKVLGVKNPDLKLVVKELHGIMRREPREAFLELAHALIDARIIECQMLAWLLLEKARIVPSLTKQEAIQLQGTLDNWVSVDTYGTVIYGILWRLGTITDMDVRKLQQEEVMWHRRLALVGTVALNLASRGGTGDSRRTIEVCTRAVSDRHDLIVKAVSWSLRSLIRWDRKAVEQFLEVHHDRLPNRVHREVGHKLEFGTKN